MYLKKYYYFFCYIDSYFKSSIIMFFKVKCYINYVKNNQLNISIPDENELKRFQNNLVKLYKNPESFDYEKKIFNIKLLSNTKIQLNYNYTTINDLRGISAIISGSSKYYCFSVNSDELDEHTNLFHTVKKIIKGYTLYANKITN